MLDTTISPVDMRQGRRIASVCQLSRGELDLPDSPVPRSKSAVAIGRRPVSRNERIGFHGKNQTLQQELCRADSVATQDNFSLAQPDDEPATEPLATACPVSDTENGSPGAASAIGKGTIVADATAVVTVARVSPSTPNPLTPGQKLRSMQADWDTATSQPWFHNKDYRSTGVGFKPCAPPVPDPHPCHSSSVFQMNRTGPIAAAVKRLEQTCASHAVHLSLPASLQKKLQQHNSACRPAVGQSRLGLALEAAAVDQRDLHVWSVPEIEQVLWLITGAYQQGSFELELSADVVIRAFKRHCKIWELSAAGVPVQADALVNNLHSATMNVLRSLSSSKALRYKEYCRPKARALLPVLELQQHLIETLRCYNNKILQLHPRRWNTLGATRLDWSVEPKDLEIVAVINSAMAVIWKAEYMPAMQPAVDLAHAVSLQVQKQCVPEADPWDRMAVELCSNINGLKLQQLQPKDLPLQKLMTAAAARAERLAGRGVAWDGSGSSGLWCRIMYALSC